MKEARFAILHDDGRVVTGTAEEVGREFLKWQGLELKWGSGEYFLRFKGGEWEPTWRARTEKEAYTDYFIRYVLPEQEDEYRTFLLRTKEQEQAFTWTMDELLDHITAKEVRQFGLSLEDEDAPDLRAWYFKNKA